MADLNLDPFLFPSDSPIAQNNGQTSGFAFDYENESGIISTSKIRNASIGNAQLGTAVIGTAQIGTLSFNEISGGTANLGGTGNGDGVVSVKNSGGTELISITNSGINITGIGSALSIQSGTSDSGKITFIRNDDTSKYVNMYLVEGGGSPYDFAVDRSSALNAADFYIGNARNWSSFTVNVEGAAELFGGAGGGGTVSVRLSVGPGTMTVDFGGTRMMSLNSAGNMKIRGTLATGVTSF